MRGGNLSVATVALPGSTISRASAPVVRNNGDHVVVRHCELLDWTGADATALTKRLFFVNTTVGVWLEAVGANYSKFRFKHVKVTYVPTTTTADPRFFVMGYFGDAADAYAWYGSTTGTYDQLASIRKSITGAAWVGADGRASLTLTRADLGDEWRYVSAFNPVSAAEARDVRTTTQGCIALTISPNSSFGGASPGRLMVEYEVELCDISVSTYGLTANRGFQASRLPPAHVPDPGEVLRLPEQVVPVPEATSSEPMEVGGPTQVVAPPIKRVAAAFSLPSFV